MRDFGKEFAHPSYGLVGFSRVSGNAGRLFGSSLPNQNTFIKLRISQATRNHHLGQDWYHHADMRPIIEVDLSAAQFAELLTGMNIGSGVPCTIRYQNGDRVADPPEELLEAEQIQHDFKGQTDKIAAEMKISQKRILELLEKKNLTQADRKEIVEALRMLVQSVQSNLPYALECFEEATTKMKVAAQAEVESLMMHALVQAGMKSLQGESQPPAVEQLPEKNDD